MWTRFAFETTRAMTADGEHKTSKYRGVFYEQKSKQSGTTYIRRKPWVAQIWANGKQYKLGYFDNEEDAARQYNDAAHFLGKDEYE